MLITHKQLNEINMVQVGILSEVASACRKLGIKYYIVHGSLLGTIRNNRFVPDDDDIDIAIYRKDYERFIKEAPAIMNPAFFIQANCTDGEYPLDFVKVRDSRTTYIIESTRHLNINHGIYIDVFPIDYCKGNKWEKIKHKLLNMRITSALDLGKTSLSRRCVRAALKIIFPSLKKTIKIREKLLTSCDYSDYVRITGGKGKEQKLPAHWFESDKKDVFEGIEVYLPNEYEKYLTAIYGDYELRTLIEEKQSDETYIEVNACVVDINKSFTHYM